MTQSQTKFAGTGKLLAGMGLPLSLMTFVLSRIAQARGVEQVSKAITQMEQVTQSTAASAEQSASA